MVDSHNERVVRTSCRGCHGVCQVLVHLDGDRVTTVTGDPDSPISKGYICPKGRAAPELLYHPQRLLYPLRRKGERWSDSWERISWDDAINEMVDKFSRIRTELGPEFVAVGQGTGRPYTEFTLRFANAFGTPNFVSPGHLCYLPRVMASGMTLGQLPVCDIYNMGGEDPKCIVVWGCNITESGSADGMCGGMLLRALRKAQTVIVVDPRRTGPAGAADFWLQIRPGTDGALALAMIHSIIAEDLYDHDFVENFTEGFDKLVDHVRHFTPDWAAPLTGLSADAIRNVARAYATTSPACLQWGNGVDMNRCNYQTGRALLILMAITGNIDRPGGDALWVYPSGVRKKSVLINHDQAGEQFLSPGQKAKAIGAGRFPFCPGLHPPTFWQSVVSGEPYRVRGMWLIGTNPLATGTHQMTVFDALKNHLEFTVVSDLFLTPTAQLADLVLPAATWLEQEDVVSMHKIWCILARKKVAQIGEVRDDRDVIFDLAHRLGLQEAFPWKDRREYNQWVVEESGMTLGEFLDKGFTSGEMRYRKYLTDGFHTPSGKFEIFSSIAQHAGVEPLPVFREPPSSFLRSQQLGEDYPLTLIGGHKNRFFFHSELRSIDTLRQRNPDPLVEINPETASALGINDGDWVRVESPFASVVMKAKLFDGIASNVVNAQHGWWFPEAEPPGYRWTDSNINLLFPDEGFDPDTGSEPIKCYICRIRKCDG